MLFVCSYTDQSPFAILVAALLLVPPTVYSEQAVLFWVSSFIVCALEQVLPPFVQMTYFNTLVVFP